MRDWHIHLERGPYTVEWAEQFVRRAENWELARSAC